MNKVIPLITDRSAAETDDTCGMKFWWNRIAEDGGIVPRAEPEALAVGAAIHEDFAFLAQMDDLSEDNLARYADSLLTSLTDDDKLDQRRMEILYRRIGWFIAWALFKEPGIRENWENVAVEGELILDRSPLWLQVTPDRLLRNRHDPLLVKYLEYKSCLSASKKWLDSWRYAIQIHSSLKAVQEEIGESIRYATVVGLVKGSYSFADDRLMHPYVWAWQNQSSAEWEHRYDKARTNQWLPMPVWEFGSKDGRAIVEWVKRCGALVADQQFPSTAPIFLDERMLDEWITRRTYRLRMIEEVKDECAKDPSTRAIYFEARTKNCRPPFGDSCPYIPLCWNAERARSPLASGDFIKRTPHHDLESIGID